MRMLNGIPMVTKEVALEYTQKGIEMFDYKNIN